MLKIEEFDMKTAMKEAYLAGGISMDDYAKWLKEQKEEPKVIIPAKKSIIDPNLAFLKHKGKEISFKKNPFKEIAERLLAKPKKMVPVGEGKFKWMDHAEEPDDDIPF